MDTKNNEKMLVTDFNQKDKIKIVDISLIKQGDLLWSNGDIVEARDVEIGEEGYNRIDVWCKDKYLSEYIYPNEFEGISKL